MKDAEQSLYLEAIECLHAVSDTQIPHREHVHAAQVEHGKHVHAPTACSAVAISIRMLADGASAPDEPGCARYGEQQASPMPLTLVSSVIRVSSSITAEELIPIIVMPSMQQSFTLLIVE